MVAAAVAATSCVQMVLRLDIAMQLSAPFPVTALLGLAGALAASYARRSGGLFGSVAMAGFVTAAALGSTSWLSWLMGAPGLHANDVLAVVSFLLLAASAGVAVVTVLTVPDRAPDVLPATGSEVSVALSHPRASVDHFRRISA